MAEVMSMLSDENPQGELNADEQESLAIGQEMAEEQNTMLAGKYKNAEELEAAYIELQKKLGEDKEESEEEEEQEETDETVESLFDRLWEQSQNDEFDEDTLKELSESDPAELAKMYLEYRNSTSNSSLSDEEAEALKGSVGGEEQYSQLMQWANENMNDQEIDMFDSVIGSGDVNAAYFAIQALSYKYGDSVGVEGKLVQGKAPTETTRGYKSQAEVVSAMQDPRYDRDPAYRQEVMAKLERSNTNLF
tara:strand:- start:555 stop:1301 length:747 start_codon:yes stop_codon:yes gene_type:complete